MPKLIFIFGFQNLFIGVDVGSIGNLGGNRDENGLPPSEIGFQRQMLLYFFSTRFKHANS